MNASLRAAGLLVVLLPVGLAFGEQIDIRTPSPNAVQASPLEVPQTYGTNSEIVQTLWASDFQLFNGFTEGAQDSGSGARSCGGGDGPCPFLATFRLPAGANIVSVELEACDSSLVSELQFFLFLAPVPGVHIQNLTPIMGTGIAAAPGCALFPATVLAPTTVNNATGSYVFNVRPAADPFISFSGGRIRYTLQVSPAPAVATFNDVPTGHPQFRFIEALAASGITVGCGAGNYCPDNNVTRGQMAVFLSKALGLHFPN